MTGFPLAYFQIIIFIILWENEMTLYAAANESLNIFFCA